MGHGQFELRKKETGSEVRAVARAQWFALVIVSASSP
jgi:hypothetical protein